MTAQIEACLNSQPLSPQLDDPESLDVLTPGHFLIGGPLIALPQPALDDLVSSPGTRWKLIQQQVQRFWRLWSTDYVQAQQHRTKWRAPCPSIKVGQLGVVAQRCSFTCEVESGGITALKPGSDGLVRVIEVRTATSTCTRPILKLAILPVSHESEPGSADVTPPV